MINVPVVRVPVPAVQLRSNGSEQNIFGHSGEQRSIFGGNSPDIGEQRSIFGNASVEESNQPILEPETIETLKSMLPPGVRDNVELGGYSSDQIKEMNANANYVRQLRNDWNSGLVQRSRRYGRSGS